MDESIKSVLIDSSGSVKTIIQVCCAIILLTRRVFLIHLYLCFDRRLEKSSNSEAPTNMVLNFLMQATVRFSLLEFLL
jgi:hypothetical protein